MSKESRMAVAAGKAFDLIDIEVNHIRKIPFLTSYKNAVKKSLLELYKFYNLDNYDQIDTIYDHIEKQTKSKIDFRKSLGLDTQKDIRNQHFVEGSFDVLNRVFKFVDGIYYVCQSYLNEEFPMYSLETPFFEISESLSKELSIPYRKALTINSKYMNFMLEHDRRIYEIKDLTNNDWFERNREYFKNVDWYTDSSKRVRKDFIESFNKEETVDEIEQNEEVSKNMKHLQRMMARRNSPEARKASLLKHKWYLTESIFDEDARYDKESKQFSSLNTVGFERLIKKTFDFGRNSEKHKLIEHELSEHISDELLTNLLTAFPELGLTGQLTESEETFREKDEPTEYRDVNGNVCYNKVEFGTIIYKGLMIKVSDNVSWSDDAQKDFETIIDLLGLKERCSYVNNKPEVTL